MRPTLIREAERLHDTTADKWVREEPRMMSDFVARPSILKNADRRRQVVTASTSAVVRGISRGCWRALARARSWALTCQRR